MDNQAPAVEPAGGGRAREPRRALQRAVGLGTDLLAGTVLFVVGGYWLDRRRGTGVFWTVGGLLLALAYGAYEVWKTVRAIEAEERSLKAAQAGPGQAGKGRT